MLLLMVDRATADAPSLDAALGAASAAWPGFHLPPDRFVEFVRERVPEGETDDGALAKLHLTDLYLVAGCLAGDAQAWRDLARVHLSQVPAYVARVDWSPAFGDEIKQRLSEKLLRGEDGKPKLASYTGRGPLAGWLRVAAVREALNAKRGIEPSETVEDIVLATKEDDPEIQLLKRKYAREFREAFRDVLGSLEPDQRNVLRLHYLDGLTLEEVGKAYRVSRATAARWIAEAKRVLVERVRETLGARLGADGPGAQSLISFVRSQLHMSLRRHFNPDEG
jgi:RNA polymerase sigma-70 factor, ECF subfamily